MMPEANSQLIFHLAIPTHNIDEAESFYTNVLGATRARRYEDRVTLKFFSHQVVCHLAPDEIDHEIKMYPRHYGITFFQRSEFLALYERIKENNYPFYKDLFIRFAGKQEAHETFFVADPSNNLIEFKFYSELSCVY